MGGIDVWEVESCTEFEAARGRSPQAKLIQRNRELTSGAGILPTDGLQRLCDLAWFPRYIHTGETRKRLRVFQVSRIEGVQDGVYGPAGEAEVKTTFFRWFGNLS